MPTLAEKQRLFTVDEYHAMGRAGILTEDDRVELIDGQIIAMSPIGSRHIACVNRLTRLFVLRLDPHAVVSVQNPVRLGRNVEPQPDIALLRPLRDETLVPHAEDVLLVVEVADTSLDFDREVKLPRYAEAGIPEVWIVALAEEHVEVYRRPGPKGYARAERRGRGDALRVEALPEAGPFSVDDVLAGP